MSFLNIFRRDALRAILAAGIAPFLPKSAHGHQAHKPNIILFLSDDQKWNVVGYEGHPLAVTPNIDALARRGVAFKNSFVTTPICASSRATLLTGTYYAKHKFNFGTAKLSEDFWPTMFPNLLRDAGYKTALIGKLGVWFEENLLGGIGRKLGLVAADNGLFDLFELVERSPYISEDEDGVPRHSLDKIDRRARRFLSNQDKSQPFCLIVAFNAPHITASMNGQGRYEPAEAEADMLPGAKVPVSPLSDPAIFDALPDVLTPPVMTGPEADKWLGTDPKNEFVDYFRLVAGVDRVVGSVLDAVRTLGFEEDTVVMFTSDNGLSLGDRRLSGKWTHFDESVRVPLVIYDPRDTARAGTRPDEFVLNVDLPSTILDFAGVEIPKEYQGRSLVPFVEGAYPVDWRTEFYGEHEVQLGQNIPNWIGVRSADYVFAEYFDEGQSVFFLTDERSDENEIVNLAGDPDYTAVLDAYRQRANEYRKLYSE
jgi:arylsulfatase A-like enzyme